MTIREEVDNVIRAALVAAYPELRDLRFEVSRPRDKAFGDLATNVAMVAAKELKTNPMETAGKMAEAIAVPSDLIASIDIKKPGFINLVISPGTYLKKLRDIGSVATDEDYGRADVGKGSKVQVEFVSANPTGPLNVVSARAAAVGDALVRLLDRVGYDAKSEFYVNDSGTQVELLGNSLKARFREAIGEKSDVPEGGYPGEYLISIAQRVKQLAMWADRASEAVTGTVLADGGADEAGLLDQFMGKEAETGKAVAELRADLDACITFKAGLTGDRLALWPALYACHLAAVGLTFNEIMAGLIWLNRYMSFVRALDKTLGPALIEASGKAARVFLGDVFEETGFDFQRFAVAEIVEGQRASLGRFGSRPEGGLRYDRWFHESSLKQDVEDISRTLVSDGRFVTEREGAVWLKGGEEEEEEEWVIRRSTGQPTYFLSDITYHINKRRRGFEQVIDIWGPDHHGHVARMQTAMQVASDVMPDLEIGQDWLRILIAQQVNLIKDGKRVQMSKRAGEYVTLDDLVKDVGADVARFFFLMRRCNSHLDFDLDLARKQSDENPVYYVQYAHARISSIIEFARQSGFEEIPAPGADLSLLASEEELEVIRALADFDDLVIGAALVLEPHRLTGYLTDLASRFHRFYHNHRVVTDDRAMSEARLYLCYAVRTVIRSALSLIGISAPEKM
jgi:arginyl-tRNA synthetase